MCEEEETEEKKNSLEESKKEEKTNSFEESKKDNIKETQQT